MYSNYNEKSSSFTLRTTDIRPYTAADYTSYTDTYRTEAGSATKYGSDLTFNVNLRTLLGDQVYNKYDHFHLVMNKMETLPYSIPSVPVNFFDTKTETCHLPFSDPENLTLEVAAGVDTIILKNDINYITDGPRQCNRNAIEIIATGGTTAENASYVDVSARVADIFTENCSITIWFKRVTSTADGDVIWGCVNSSNTIFMLTCTGSSLKLESGFFGISMTAALPPLNVWTHVVCTIGVGGATIFVNGVQVLNTASPVDWITYNPTRFYLGALPRFDSGGAPIIQFDSNYDLADFRTYAKRLSLAEVGELYSDSVNRYNLLNVYLSGPQLSISGYDLKTKNNHSHAHIGIIGPLMTKAVAGGSFIQYYGPWMSDTSIEHINQTYPNRDIVVRKQQTIQIRLTFGGVHTDDRTIPESIFVKRPKFPYLIANFTLTPIVD